MASRITLTVVLICFVLGQAWATPTSTEALSLVRSFYKPAYKTESLPLSGGLQGLYHAAHQHSKKTDSVVAGLDFDWISNSQDAEEGWQRTARFKPLAGNVVQVSFRNFKQDNVLRYHLVIEKGTWKVDDISCDVPQKWVLSQMLSKGAHE